MSAIQKILNLCARVESNSKINELIHSACQECTDWDDLLVQAEEQGMGPLLYNHLAMFSDELPISFIRALRFLFIRHRQTNAILDNGLYQALGFLETIGIPCLVLKGAALSHTLYPEIGLRPMRDIDLLLTKENAQRSHELLQKNGFRASTAIHPENHFHLPPLYQSIDGFQVCIELHHDLFPENCPPYYHQLPFSQLYQNKTAFEVNGVTAYTLSTEEMLWHLYQHAFHAPLSYEQYKLISVADLVSLVESKKHEINWGKVKSTYPRLYHALPLFHYLTPWSEEVLEKIPLTAGTVPAGVGRRFTGWPLFKLSAQKNKGVIKILGDTFFPPRWWLMVYYSPRGWFSAIYCRWIQHPIHIFWWIKLYWSIFLESTLPPEKKDKGRWTFMGMMKNSATLVRAMYGKFN